MWFFACLFFVIGNNSSQGQTPGAPKLPLGPLAPVNVYGMTFTNYWMPTHLDTKSALQAGLKFYAEAVVGTAEPRHEPAPTTLVGPLKWLMPYDEAVKTLPARIDRAPEEKMSFDCFPKDSLTIAGFQLRGTSFDDQGEAFEWMYLILDRQRRLVGVELVAMTPKKFKLLKTKKEPYYDFIKMKNNARAGQYVGYEIVPGGTGVSLIHTQLIVPPFKCLENVHWYLAAPFARTLLDIAEFQKTGVKPK